MGKPLSPAQEKARNLQLVRNEEYLSSIDVLLEEFEPFYKESEKYNKHLLDLYQKLDNAHGMLLQGKYANLYTKHLGKPATQAINLSFEISDEFFFLEGEHTKKFLEPLPDLDSFQERVDSFFSKIKPLFDDAFSENSIIIRFEGMEQIYTEFKQLSEHWNYPRELALSYAMQNREYIQPIIFHGIPTVHPFHVEVYINYSPMLNTVLLLKGNLQKLRSLLKTINAQLPYAELNEKIPHIQNIVSGIDKSTTVGENASIGNKNAIGDNASVEGE